MDRWHDGDHMHMFTPFHMEPLLVSMATHKLNLHSKFDSVIILKVLKKLEKFKDDVMDIRHIIFSVTLSLVAMTTNISKIYQ